MKLVLFTNDSKFAREAEQAGIDSIILDWENRGKNIRQKGHDLEINADTPEDLQRITSTVKIPVTVRINAPGPYTQDEIDCALEYGASIIMLPMAQNTDEVSDFVNQVNGRAQTIVQIETKSLVDQLNDLKKIPWDYSFIGLNDLMISRGCLWLWDSLMDGTVETIFRDLSGRSVGFGGITIIDGGTPIPFPLLLHEMIRLGCSISFMRRTFHKEFTGRNLPAEIQAIRSLIKSSKLRHKKAVAADHSALFSRLKAVRKDLQKNNSVD